ncbi:uncharacterized protein LOC111087951 [Limulus polyphemus]|uniref:Uncharacterized protein LOC111087951 n=1 Tax=Limulus polyphemus TaxID=6850 RepID=A0ABM1T8F7_LIMPO|nr:uncharacterized protein LOC111087951 [Limulus polyphemus]
MKTGVKGILIVAIVISSCVLDTAAYVHHLNPSDHQRVLLKSASKYAQNNENIANGIITGGLTIAGLYALLKRIPGVGEFLLKIGLLFKASTGQVGQLYHIISCSEFNFQCIEIHDSCSHLYSYTCSCDTLYYFNNVLIVNHCKIKYMM